MYNAMIAAFGMALAAFALLANGCGVSTNVEVEDTPVVPKASPLSWENAMATVERKRELENPNVRDEPNPRYAPPRTPDPRLFTPVPTPMVRECKKEREASYRAGEGAHLYALKEERGEEFSRVYEAVDKVYQEMLDAAETKEEIQSVHDWHYAQLKRIDEGIGAAYLDASDAYMFGLSAYEYRHPCDVRGRQ